MTPSCLTSDQFTVWRKSLGMSHAAAAKRLGLSVSAIYMYENGQRKIPLLVCLGMSAINNNLQYYGGENANNNNSNSES